ncbi:DUF6049 family protein [Microbacterium sp. P06]|uniref:DUF6049 family protein n=1 Tax=Microbacterium sp. P06 TaxID=3366949 RepID=UPI00374711E7
MRPPSVPEQKPRMIVTSSVPRSRASRRRPLRLLAATGAILALLFAGAVPAIAAASPAPDATATSSEPALTLVPAANGVLQPGSDLTVSVTLTGGSGASTVSLAIGEQPLADRAALTAWTAGDRGGVTVTEIGTGALDAPASGGATSVSIGVVSTEPGLLDRPAGVYPIVATATVAGVPLASTSAVVIPGPRTPVDVAVVVPITAPAISQGLLPADTLAELTAADGALTAQLDAVSETPAILAVDPAIPAAIRVLGDAAPGTARAWLDRLLALPNSRFALQFGDADIATQLQSGLAEPLSPLSLISYLPAGTVAPAGDPSPAASDTAAPTASPSPTPDATPLVPDLASLTDIGDDRSSVFWPVGGTAGAGVVTALGSLGSPETPALTLVPSASTTAGADGTRIGARVDSSGSALLAYDSTVSDLLRSAADATEPTSRDASLAAVTAQLALVDPSSPILVTVDRGQDRSRTNLRAAIDAASGAPATVPVTLDDIAAAPAAAPVDVPEVAPDAGRVADLTGLLADVPGLERFATILDDPALLTGRERAEILQLLGAGWRADADAAQAAVTAHRAATVTTIESVTLLASDVNLLSYNANYGPFVRNALPWPVNVTLIANPNDARLIVQTRTVADSLPANANTRVVVPVEAQIANGQVDIDMRLVSPTGDPIGSPLTVAVEVHADWENIGLAILGGLLALFVAAGIVRTVLRRRAARRAPGEPDVEATA